MTTYEINSIDEFWRRVQFPECFFECRKQTADTTQYYNIATGELLAAHNDKIVISTVAPADLMVVDPLLQFIRCQMFIPVVVTAAEFALLPDNNYYYETNISPKDATRWYNISNGSMLTRDRFGKIRYAAVAEPGFTTVKMNRPFPAFKIYPEI